MTLQSQPLGHTAPRLSPTEHVAEPFIPPFALDPPAQPWVWTDADLKSASSCKLKLEVTSRTVPVQAIGFVKQRLYTVDRPPTPHPFGHLEATWSVPTTAAKVPSSKHATGGTIGFVGGCKTHHARLYETDDLAPKGRIPLDAFSWYQSLADPSLGEVAAADLPGIQRPRLVRRNAIRFKPMLAVFDKE